MSIKAAEQLLIRINGDIEADLVGQQKQRVAEQEEERTLALSASPSCARVF